MYASASSRDAPSVLMYSPFDSWAANSDWQMNLPEGEEATAVAAGHTFCAVATSQRMLRMFSQAGVPCSPSTAWQVDVGKLQTRERTGPCWVERLSLLVEIVSPYSGVLNCRLSLKFSPWQLCCTLLALLCMTVAMLQIAALKRTECCCCHAQLVPIWCS